MSAYLHLARALRAGKRPSIEGQNIRRGRKQENRNPA